MQDRIYTRWRASNMGQRNVSGGFGSAPQRAKVRGYGYSGPDSANPTQPQEGDLANLGGTAPGGTVAFVGAASQWNTSNAANRNKYPTGQPDVDPITAAHLQHYGLKDEAPDAHGEVPIHPGLKPGLFRTARDANYAAPDGQTTIKSQGRNDPTAADGRPSSPGGLHRGESPEVLKQTRGGYRP